MFLNRMLCYVILVVFSQGLIAQTQHSNTTNSKKEMSNKLGQPSYLKAGDSVAIVAPSGILNHREDEINQAKTLLKSWGLHVVVGKHVFKKNNHFAGTDSERAEDFQQALDNPNIKAIWCARGGYGTVRILDVLDYKKFKKNPKWIIGYSDITALHNDIHNLNIESIHALMCTSLTDDLIGLDQTISTLKDVIFGKPISYNIEGSNYNKVGEVKGQLVGGNLTVLHTMLGSKSSINTKNKILFIEEIGEYAYHIDRMLQSLMRAGYFDECAGVIVGDISKVRKNTTPWGKPIEQLILDVFEDCDFPVMFNFPAGHEKDNRALILGRTIDLKVTKDRASVIFKG